MHPRFRIEGKGGAKTISFKERPTITHAGHDALQGNMLQVVSSWPCDDAVWECTASDLSVATSPGVVSEAGSCCQETLTLSPNASQEHCEDACRRASCADVPAPAMASETSAQTISAREAVLATAPPSQRSRAGCHAGAAGKCGKPALGQCSCECFRFLSTAT